MQQADDLLDCAIIGGGPAGLTAALYLARFGRRFVVLDAGAPRAAWIPSSHTIPFAYGISGPDLLARQRATLARYGAAVVQAEATHLRKHGGCFEIGTQAPDGARRTLRARRVLLATGAVDVEPDLPDVPDAVRRGLLRYCPICDGYEARGRRIAVVGHGNHGLGEASFIARTYASDVTLLTLGDSLDAEARRTAADQGITLLEQPIRALTVAGNQIAAIRTGDGREYRFDTLYSALGLIYRSDLALRLGADHDPSGALCVDAHNQTSVPGLYAAGDIVRGLDQIVVGMAHAATAATHIHNRCELPTEDEPDPP